MKKLCQLWLAKKSTEVPVNSEPSKFFKSHIHWTNVIPKPCRVGRKACPFIHAILTGFNPSPHFPFKLQKDSNLSVSIWMKLDAMSNNISWKKCNVKQHVVWSDVYNWVCVLSLHFINLFFLVIKYFPKKQPL